MTHEPHRATPIRAPRHSKIPAICVASLVLVLGGMLASTASETLRPAPTVRVVPVVSASTDEIPSDRPASASAGSSVTVQAPGWIEPDPYYTACTALADGVLETIHVLEGEQVEQGQLVASLIKDDARLALDRAQAELDTARAELGSARAVLVAARTDWDHPVQRERAVETARAALDRTVAELAQLPALIDAERAQLERLQEDLARLENAQRSNAVNSFEVVIRSKDVARQSAVLDAITQRRAILEAEHDSRSAELRAAERDFELRVAERRAVDDAQSRVLRAEAQVALHTAHVAQGELRLSRMDIYAPISGFVQERVKLPGDKVMFMMDSVESAHILHIYDPENLQVRVDVPLADASHVSVGQRCEVVVDVLPDTTFAGEVTRITHQADLQKNTLQVKVRVIDPPTILKPDMLTRVKFLPSAQSTGESSATDERAPVVVTSATLRERDADRALVWSVRERQQGAGVARRVSVEIVEETGDLAHVRADLRPGDLLVADDTALSEGQRVRLAQLTSGGAK